MACSPNDTPVCISDTIKGPFCGDNDETAGEVCRDGNDITEAECNYGTPLCTACSGDCKEVLNLKGPYCGDGIINGGEGCDVAVPEFCNNCVCSSAHAVINEEMSTKFSAGASSKEIIVDTNSGLVWQRERLICLQNPTPIPKKTPGTPA